MRLSGLVSQRIEEDFHELGASYYTRRIGKDRKARGQIRQLEALGFTVTSPRPHDQQRTPRPPAGGQGPTRARPGLTGAGSLPRTAEVRALIFRSGCR